MTSALDQVPETAAGVEVAGCAEGLATEDAVAGIEALAAGAEAVAVTVGGAVAELLLDAPPQAAMAAPAITQAAIPVANRAPPIERPGPARSLVMLSTSSRWMAPRARAFPAHARRTSRSPRAATRC